jgi:tape measure domain-containing protein
MNVSGYVSSARDAGRATDELAQRGQNMAKQQQQAMGQMQQMASNAARGLVNMTRGALIGATTATVGLGVAALRTGVAYNSLEQTSRAALTTLLGSAEQANRQMDQLRQFGRTSPFPRQVWIEAQNQLLGFGFAAEDVVPTLSAINDAMSALGGNDQAIREVVRVLAQVKSTGQVTAGTLNQLGIRGVNAAELLGNAFGKSAGQIREEIRSGAIDANTFLTTLVEQMEVRYAGAADLVRQTWTGALDRIAGAFRDIGSIIASPFIDPKGGGAAVDWANALADAMRILEGTMGPVVEELSRRAGPAFERITGFIEAAGRAIEGVDARELIDQMSTFSPVLVGLGAAGLRASAGAIPFLGDLAKQVLPGGPLLTGILAALLAIPEFRDMLRDLFDALAPLGPAAMDIAEILLGMLTTAIGGITTLLEPIISVLGTAVELFAKLPDPVQAVVVAMVLLHGPLSAIGPMLAALPGYLAALPARFAGVAGAMGALRVAGGGLMTMLGGPWGIALGAIAVGAMTLGDSTRYAGIGVNELRGELLNLRSTEDLGPIIEQVRESMDSFDNTIKILGIRLSTEWGSGLFAGTQASNEFKDAMQLLDAAMAGMVASGDIDRVEQAVHWLSDALGISREEARLLIDEYLPHLRDALAGVEIDAGNAGKGIEEFVEHLSSAEQQSINAEEALKQYQERLRGMTDPVFRLNDALDAVETAQSNYNEAVEEYGKNSAEADAASWELAKAVANLEQAALDGDLSFESFDRKLDQWVRQGLITEEQAKKMRERVIELTKSAEDFEDEYIATVGIDKLTYDDAIQRLERLGALIDGLPSRKDVTIAALTGHFTPTFGITRAHGGPVDGHGSPHVDSIPAMLAPGEWVMKAAARAKYGDKFMRLVNEGRWPTVGRSMGGPVPITRINIDFDTSKFDATDFLNAAGRVAAAAGRAVGLSSGTVLPRGSYRIGRGSAAHGYGALDLPAPIGTPVYSVAAGIVSRALRLATSYGIHAFINHAGGRQSRYAHFSSLLVRTGQAVNRGQLIGRVGSTGNSTGPHLHYEDLINGVRRQPERLGIFDGGGYLRPGLTLAYNGTGGREMVLDRRSTEAMERLLYNLAGQRQHRIGQAAGRTLDGRSAENSINVRVYIGDRELTDLVDVRVEDGLESFTRAGSSGRRF